MQCRSGIRLAVGGLLLARAASLFAADLAPAESPHVSPGVPPEWVGKGKHPFLKSPKPPFPNKFQREVVETGDMKYNAIAKLIINHGKIVAVPIGGNHNLAQYLASWVQKHWAADPRITGTFTLPMKFMLGGDFDGIEPQRSLQSVRERLSIHLSDILFSVLTLRLCGFA